MSGAASNRGRRRHLKSSLGTFSLTEAQATALEVSKGGSDAGSNLRTLCRRCHCLRSSIAHQGMISAALREGVIPPNWRILVWEG